MHTPQVTVEIAGQLGISPEEFDKICQLMGRTPNFTELSVYSVMWSEHCSYKNSILQLKTLPKAGKNVMAGAGEEGAGLMDIGDGLAVAFKMESHNHPSAIEPYQGAATGVGGIHRDIFSLGARPIAALDSLRFGDPASPKTRHLVKGVVKGIGNYGNAFGVPTVGGEVYFDPCYNTNPLVNAMSVGIVEHGKAASSGAKGVGNPVFIMGAATGKDGIHGATFASEDISEDSQEKLPSVQVGDPFTEKLILEATLEIIGTGTVVACQDMGAAGITCSTSEMAAKGELGMEVWLDKVPMRQPNMVPFEILLSESQERMLFVVEKGTEAQIEAICAKWDLPCAQIGVLTDSGLLRYHFHGEVVAEIDAQSLVLGGGAPVYVREQKVPAYFEKIAAFDPASIAIPDQLEPVVKALVSLPSLASKKWIVEQYDSMVGTANITTNAPSDAAVVRIKGTNKALVLSADCNSRFVHANPEQGAMLAVAECARNLVCAGGTPIGVTNCLNFGNPYNPEVYFQFAQAIKGMGAACLKFDTPVTGGNVSFYNQSEDGPVFPTPTIGMVGVLEDAAGGSMSMNFKQAGDELILLGRLMDDFGSATYLYQHLGVALSPAPYVNLDEESALQKTVLGLIGSKAIRSAHDVSDGGLMLSLLESGFSSGMGFAVSNPTGIRKDAFWLGESGGRVVVSVPAGDTDAVMSMAGSMGVPAVVLGKVTPGNIEVDGETWSEIGDFQALYDSALERALGLK